MATERILLVEDNEQNLELALFLLEEEGYEVRTARDVDEFESAIAEPPPDLVLLDMHLPGTDGLTLLGRLRELPTHANVPVVALTAHAMRGDRERFLAAGCDGYLSKPIDIKTFAPFVRTFLDERKGGGGTGA
jgi:two-component system cell cycle response regulator DivK